MASKTGGLTGNLNQSTEQGGLRGGRRIVVILTVATLLVVGAALLYARHAASQPENILRTALANSLRAGSADVGLTAVTAEAGQEERALRLSGAVAEGGRFDLSGDYMSGNDALGVQLRSADGKDAFARLTSIDRLGKVLGEDAKDYGITDSFNPLLGLEGKWLVVPADLKETILMNRADDSQTDLNLDAVDKQKLADLYLKHEFLNISGKLADENIDSVTSYHYAVTVDKPQFEAYLRGVQQGVTKLRLQEKQIQSLLGLVDASKPLDVWISKDANRFTKLSYASADSDTTRRTVLTLHNYDRTVSVDKPADAVPLFEALGTLFQNGNPAFAPGAR